MDATAVIRDIDSAVATLDGEGAQQQVRRPDAHLEQMSPQPWNCVPDSRRDPTYYDRPLLKKSVWSIDIPLYYFVGGAAGAAMTLAAALQLASAGKNRRSLRGVSAVCHWTGIAGSTLGAAFLIHDLGRPARFLYMMRIFRPTSPMNMGVWILGAAAPTAIATGLFLNRPGVLGLIGESAGYASGIFGAGLACYTGVLVANSAIPVWQAARRWMPIMFMASSAATVGSLLDLFAGAAATRTVALIFGTAGRIAEIAAAQQVERAASKVPRVAAPFHRGGGAVLWKAATVATAASLGLALAAGKSRGRARFAGILGAAGSLMLRLAVHYISNASSADARASFRQQRAALASRSPL